jgi:hypothetical protein
MLGWGASLGALVGASAGAAASAAGRKGGRFADLIRDAIASGQVVLVVDTRSEQETATARAVIQASVGLTKDVSAG